MSKCKQYEDIYLDCQGYYDLSSEILGLLAIVFFIFRAYNNTSQYQVLKKMNLTSLDIGQKIIQKIRINQLSLIFLVCLMVELLISVTVFSLYFPQENAYEIEDWVKKLYKIVEIACVNFLNALIVYVAYFYWISVGDYKRQKQDSVLSQSTKKSMIPLEGCFAKSFERIFYIVHISTFLSFLASSIIVIFSENSHDKNFQWENGISAGITFISVAIFIYMRWIFNKTLQKNTQIQGNQARLQYMITIAVIMTSFLRVMILTNNMTGLVSISLRNYGEDCLDKSIGHAFFLLALTGLVNLAPACVFVLYFKPKKLRLPLSQTQYSSDI